MPEAKLSTNSTPPLSLGILAGGEGQRVGGEDKGLLLFNQKPLIEHVLQAAPTELFSSVTISANRNLQRYQQYGQVVSDAPEHQGPLAGLAALLGACETEWLLTLPCDCPRLPPDFGEKLARFLLAVLPEQQGAVMNDGERDQNAVLLLRRNALPSLLQYLKQGDKAVHRFLKPLTLTPIIFNHWPAEYWNANTIEALQHLIDRQPL